MGLDRVNACLPEENAEKCKLEQKCKELAEENGRRENELRSLDGENKHLQEELDALDREFVEYKESQHLKNEEQKPKKHKQMRKRAMTTKQSDTGNHTLEIRAKIIEKELFDEQQRAKELNAQ